MAEASILGDVASAATLEEAAARLGTLLELGRPAPLSATRRALADSNFARALVGVRKMPAVRDRLLASEIRAAGASTSIAPPAAQSAVRAAGAVLKWGMEGLRPAMPWVIERRLAACNDCEFRAEAPDTLIYRGAKVLVGKDAKVCTVCACLINTKAAISTERCPEPDPAHPERSRWGEPWTDPSEHPDGPWR